MKQQQSGEMAARAEDYAGQSSPILRLVQKHKDFLDFLAARLGDRATAEDVLQSAYVKASQRLGQLREEDSIVAWFYRILRNAITDHYRRTEVESRKLAEFSAEAPVEYEPELKGKVCACISDALVGLKPEYQQAIEQVDLGESTVEAYARQHNISTNNASVRLHRARKAVAKNLMGICGVCAEHKCLDCTCKKSSPQL